MPSTYSPNLRIELIASGEQANQWGNTTNKNLGTLIEEAIAGLVEVDVTAGNVTLTALDGATDQSRHMILSVIGTPGTARQIIAPAVSKIYVVSNGSDDDVEIVTDAVGSVGPTIPSGVAKSVFCDSVDFAYLDAALVDTANSAVISDADGVVIASSVSATELGYLQGVTSAIQTQLNAKQATITGAATTITASNLTANRALISDASGKVGVSATVSDTELGYLDGVTSAIQTQLDAKAPTTSGTSILYGNGSGGFSNVTIGSNLAFVGGTLSAPGISGTVTSVGLAMPSGFSVANSPVTGAGTLTVTTSLSGIIKGTGSAFTAAAANTDYLAPALANTAVTGFKTATFNSQTTIATTSGAITVDWASAQNQLQTEPTGTITYTFTSPPGPCHLQLIINSDGTSTAQTINWPGTLTWMGATWAGTNNKKAVINIWFDGANYFAMGTNQA